MRAKGKGMIEVCESLESPEEEGEGGDTRHGQRWKIPNTVLRQHPVGLAVEVCLK